MPQYLKTLYEFKKEGRENVSSVQLAEALDLTPSIVKKDLSQAKVQDGGRFTYWNPANSKNSYLKAKGLLPPDEEEEGTDSPSEI